MLRVHAGRKQVVRAFCTAFRRFVESPEYHPQRYEGHYLGDHPSAVEPGLNYMGFGLHLRPMRSRRVEDWLG